MRVRVNHCCCGYSLQTGTQILGWLYLIGGFLQMFRIAMMLMPDETRYPETNILIGFLVGSVVWNAVSILLLFSAHKNGRPGLMLPWLICKAVMILGGIGLGLFLSVYFMQDSRVFALILIGIICSAAFGFALSTYFWLVIYSYYQQLKEEQLSTKEKLNYSKFDSSNDV